MTGCSRSSPESAPWSSRSRQVELDVVGAGPRRTGQARGVAFLLGQLACRHGQRVVLAGIEVSELVDPVQDIGDELLQEHAGRDADLAA